MKYIITETKFNNAFQKVIDSFIGELKKPYLQKVLSSQNRFIYENDKGVIVFIVLEEFNNIEIYINEDVYSTVAKLMSANKSNEIQKQFIEWIKNNLGIQFDTIYTFREPEYVY